MQEQRESPGKGSKMKNTEDMKGRSVSDEPDENLDVRFDGK
jgi:hypothetical protein